ncbi:MAG: extracellular solute-binding protein [Candidatus Pacebacteria bacterium]|nr:extracellular solute-binding protein [Candidatus Paceibacterota bacterium]
MSQFQIILISIFGFFILIGVVLFAGFKADRNNSVTGDVSIWGSIDKDIMDDVLKDLIDRDDSFEKVKYTQIDSNNFDNILAEAMAEDKGPDLFFLPQSKIIKHQNKILAIPYKTFSERDFKNYFIEEGELYLVDDGILALPFIIDPLVMYWNRDIHTRMGVAKPPRYWDTFFDFARKVTEKDLNANILTSAVALGGYQNINNAKEILLTLIMQTGNPIAIRDEDDNDMLEILLKKDFGGEDLGAESALRFYTEFTNPAKEIYSWNSSMPNSKNMFLAGDLALYFGFASEMSDLQNKNPNLNFDVSFLPQISELKNVISFGKMEALAINKGSKNPAGAYGAAMELIKNDTLLYLNSITKLPPVSRVILSKEPIDPYQNVFFKAALSAKGFLDMSVDNTDLIFQSMVESVISGRRKLSEAVSRADAEMCELIK